ncbi:MAG TPA: flagellar basal body-associated FliL family protein [Steroidobacteraceae bacterium]|nr:flagellar basal body-associated FliL family protein [Steroidobacteraceae bacterium]
MSEAKPEAAAATPPKSKKKLLLVIAAVVVLMGGGAGAYFAFFHGKSDETAEAGKDGKSAKADKNDKGKKKGKEEKKEPKLPAQFVELDPPFVVNFAPGSTSRFLQVTVQLMTREPEMSEFLKTNSPIIRNDLLLLLGNRTVEEVSTNEGREALRAKALETVRKIITSEGGKGEGLEAVYFTSFVMQ